jgi:hypothetical protein
MASKPLSKIENSISNNIRILKETCKNLEAALKEGFSNYVISWSGHFPKYIQADPWLVP